MKIEFNTASEEEIDKLRSDYLKTVLGGLIWAKRILNIDVKNVDMKHLWKWGNVQIVAPGIPLKRLDK